MKRAGCRVVSFIAACAIAAVFWTNAPGQVASVKDIKKVYVTDVTGDISEKMGDILASEISKVLLKTLKIEAFSTKNLEQQLGFEKTKELMNCSDNICVNEIVSNFGIASQLSSDVKRLGGTSYYVDLTLYDRGKKVSAESKQVECKDDGCLIKVVGGLALELFGKKGDGGREIEERAIGEKPAGGFEISGP
ncbi:MAG: hypothetical protein FJ088_02040, partial [Deltaproteobacteria bacterium]|nr:hypothetical protein [Deltaproteobacteria bacterium]